MIYIVLLADSSYHSADHPARSCREQAQDHRRHQMHRIRVQPLMQDHPDEYQYPIIERPHQKSPQIFAHARAFPHEKSSREARYYVNSYDRAVDKCL